VVHGNVPASMLNYVRLFSPSVKRDLLVQADMQKIQLALHRLGIKFGGLVYLANTPGLQPGANGSNPLSSTKISNSRPC
jgi:hypothetical protein